MRILLTGAGGQLGRALQAVLQGDHEVLAFDRSRLDVARLEAVREAVKAQRPDLVLNAAAYNAVDQAQTDAEGAYRGNAAGPRNLALAAAEVGAAILHVSSDYVFDGLAERPYHEYDRPNPQSVYGASKLAGEGAVRELNHRHYVVRTAWLYGPQGKNFALTMLGAARTAPQVRVVDDQTGSPTYVPHLAQALRRLLATGAFGTYHLAGRGGTTWFGLTRALYAAAGVATPVLPVTTAEFPRPAPRPRFSVLTTLQDPAILLPPWEEGVLELARAIRSDVP